MKIPSIVITPQVREEIVHSLREVNCPSHVIGYYYLKTALEVVLSNPESIRAITKELYPAVAKIHQTTANGVERAMRHAVALIYDRTDSEIANERLGAHRPNKSRLTNSEFLTVVAENIRETLNRPSETGETPKDAVEEERLAQLRQDLITLGVLKE